MLYPLRYEILVKVHILRLLSLVNENKTMESNDFEGSPQPSGDSIVAYIAARVIVDIHKSDELLQSSISVAKEWMVASSTPARYGELTVTSVRIVNKDDISNNIK
jgi:hypothetical protein